MSIDAQRHVGEQASPRAARSLASELWDDQWESLTAGLVPRAGRPSTGPRADAWGPDVHFRSIKGYADCRRSLNLPELETHIGNGNLRQNDANLLFLDGEVHERLRGIIKRVLPDWRVAAESSTAFIDRLVAALPEQGMVDLVTEVAVPIAEDMTFSILGLRPDEHPGFADKLLAMSAQFDPSHSPEVTALAIDTGREVMNILRTAVRDGTCDAEGGLARLDRARRAGELSVREQLASSVLLAHASFQNTVNLLSFAAAEAMTNAALAETMAGADRAAQRRSVEEVLRLGCPVRFLVRRAAADITLGDAEIHAGDIVSPFIHDANRDGSAFPRPDEFDPSRVGATHLTFGAGPHLCLGAAIARAETTATIRALVARYRSFELVSVTWGTNAVMFGPANLVALLGP